MAFMVYWLSTVITERRERVRSRVRLKISSLLVELQAKDSFVLYDVILLRDEGVG
jgi:hypothetical protein